MKWLVTAFEPFAGAKSNSSSLVAQALAKENWNEQVDFYFPLPVSYENAWKKLSEKIQNSNQYDGVLALGQAEGRKKISVERLALNWVDAPLADNDGIIIQNQKISNGPTVYWSKLPWENFQLPQNCERSYSAGTFVCNQLMYQLAEWGQQNNILTGFVHIPLVETQEVDFPGVKTNSLDGITASMTEVLKFLTTHLDRGPVFPCL